jgi:hypothetical protein
VPDVAEKEALKGKMNSNGETWHTWMTGMRGAESDDLPAKARQDRADLAAIAQPQGGVNAMNRNVPGGGDAP